MFFALDSSTPIDTLPNFKKIKLLFESTPIKKKYLYFYPIKLENPNNLEKIFSWIREDLWSENVSCGIREKDLDLKAAFFDMDATVLEDESLVTIAKSLKLEKEIADITEKAMNGHLDFKEALNQRLNLIRGLPHKNLLSLVKKSKIRPRAKLLIQNLSENQVESYLLSGGFKNYTLFLKRELGFKNHFSNDLLFLKNIFTGKLKNKTLIDAKEKANIVKKICQKKSWQKHQIAAIGDGANDIPMMESSGTRIGIFPKKKLQAHLNFSLFKNNMETLCDFLTPSLVTRCGWVTRDPLYQRYHDIEWGRPVYEDSKHFEFLVLESAQAGLSWITVLKKRENYRKLFANFNPKLVARFDNKKITELMKNPGIIRNRAKIEAAVNNAICFLNIQEEFGSFNSYCWQFVGGRPIVNRWKKLSQIPARSKESDAFAKDLKARGFKFLGSTVLYAHMQAVGMVMDHLLECHCYEECENKLSTLT